MAHSSVLETVYTVHDYYDGPRQGVADFEGQPVFYDCIFSESAQDYINRYQLTRMPLEILPFVLEDWAIWKRWELAFATGQTTHDTHPALPSDRSRKEELASILAPYFKTDLANCIVRVAKFQVAEGVLNYKGVLKELQVEWSMPGERSDGGPSSRIWR